MAKATTPVEAIVTAVTILSLPEIMGKVALPVTPETLAFVREQYDAKVKAFNDSPDAEKVRGEMNALVEQFKAQSNEWQTLNQRLVSLGGDKDAVKAFHDQLVGMCGLDPSLKIETRGRKAASK